MFLATTLPKTRATGETDQGVARIASHQGVVTRCTGHHAVQNREGACAGLALQGAFGIGVGSRDADGLAKLGGSQGEGGGRCAGDGDAIGQPFIADCPQAVDVSQGVGGCCQDLSLDRRTADRDAAGRQVVDGADVERGGVGRGRDCGTVGNLEAEAGIGAAVGVGRRGVDQFAGSDIGGGDDLVEGDIDAIELEGIYLALGVLPDGTRDILGLWIENTEGAKFWMKVFNDLKTRGVADILIAVTDGLKGMPEALAAVFPATTLQTCIVHLIRNSLDYASWKDRKALAAAIKPIYTAPSAEAAMAQLEAFSQGPWGEKFPTVAAAWRRAWDRVIPFFAFPPAIRRVIYTTNAIESINARLRKIIKTRGHFPSDDAASKLIWLALRNITADWGRAAKDWKDAMNQFAILYAERFEVARG